MEIPSLTKTFQLLSMFSNVDIILLAFIHTPTNITNPNTNSNECNTN